ncbi:MAG: hypothetical protein HC804_11680 [Anaerolineae bacterium]|nr:hypothetical protein [Anaerolineae bacterium]
MSIPIQSEHFSKALYLLLDETFDNVNGIYLDKGTSLFETLATISAEEASIPVGGKCATLAAQVKHVAFYLDVLEHNVRTQQFEKVDWSKIWREVTAVPPQNGNQSKQSYAPATTASNNSSTTQPPGPANMKSVAPSP